MYRRLWDSNRSENEWALQASVTADKNRNRPTAEGYHLVISGEHNERTRRH